MLRRQPSAKGVAVNTQIRELTYVACPSAQAKHHLAEFFREHSVDGAVRLMLRVPPAKAEGVTLEREVEATLTPAVFADAIEAFVVHWTPVAGPYPTFDGTLRAREDERYESFILELEGSYEPPFGLVGAAFDAIVGRHLAQATARALLDDIAQSVEDQFRRCEEDKARKRHLSVASL
jgi:hypothetical protein